MVVMTIAPLLLFLVSTGCNRPTSQYDVGLYGAGASLEDLGGAPIPMGGYIEYARIRLFGTNLGHGITGLYGDQPRADGTAFVTGTAAFAYPADSSFDNVSLLVTPGPQRTKGKDRCVFFPGQRSYPGSVEYVDVGDQVLLSGEDLSFRLPRDPVIYPRPAGEAWYVEYGSQLAPVLNGYEPGADNWRSGASLGVSFPGGLPPQYATVGAIPYPLSDGTMELPPDILDLQIGGEEVKAPSGDLRFHGPWEEAMELSWTPSDEGAPLTISLRALGYGEEGPCDCSEDCGPGFFCEDGACLGEDGASWNQLGELVCTVEDDGSFSLAPSEAQVLVDQAGSDWAGSILVASRSTEGQLQVPDVLTFNGKRISNGPVRTRGIDAIFTRVEVPR
jgi:hypothetical protein